MTTYRQDFQLSLVAFYAWIATVSFGAILLDVAYANSLRDALSATASRSVFSDVADLLLLVAFVAIIAAIGAIALSWEARITRRLLVASLLVLLSEFIFPLLVTPIIQSAQNPNIGPWMRIVLSGLGSMLAFAAMHQYRTKMGS